MRLSVVVALVTLFSSPLLAQQPLDEFNRRILVDLGRRSPEAAVELRAADSARARDSLPAAEGHYRRVLELVPGYIHAQRRLCDVLGRQDQRAEALSLCRDAFSREKSVENRAALAVTLVSAPKDQTASSTDIAEAAGHAEVLLALDHPDVYTLAAVCQVAMGANQLDLLNKCVTASDREIPDSLPTQFFGWVAAVSNGNFAEADRRLERARAAGLPLAQYQGMKTATDKARPKWPRYAKAGATIAGAWLLGIALLFAIGGLLSRAALKAANRLPGTQTGEASGLDAKLRHAYGVVLWLSCLYFYISIPVVLAVVVLLGGGIIYGFFALGRIPIKLVVIVAGVVLVTLWATLKSLFIRVKDEDPGTRLDVAQHPRFRDVLQEVAGEIKTRPVDSVYLTPGVDLAVMERGGLFRKMRGAAERCLILGVGGLEGMKIGPFKAVLAHEYGHFSNRDTAGGGFALGVRRSVLIMAVGLAEGGAATWYNPAWLFVQGFYRVFLRISQGASRLQEVMADRWAAFVYGAKQFERGLRHLIERTIRFHVHTNATLQEVMEGRKGLANLYAYVPAQPLPEDEIGQQIRDAIEREPSPYDSHPSPKDRFTWVHALGASTTGDLSEGEEDAWTLFSNRAQVETLMTDQVRINVRKHHGLLIEAEDTVRPE